MQMFPYGAREVTEWFDEYMNDVNPVRWYFASSDLSLKETYDAFLHLFPLTQCFIYSAFLCMFKI